MFFLVHVQTMCDAIEIVVQFHCLSSYRNDRFAWIQFTLFDVCNKKNLSVCNALTLHDATLPTGIRQ